MGNNMVKPKRQVICANPKCKRLIHTTSPDKTCCGPACYVAAYGVPKMPKTKRKKGAPRKLSTGSVGAIGELLVSSDLLRKGVHVFRSLSPHCPCDLLILNDFGAFRVEVRTGRRERADGKLYFPFGFKDLGRHDILAVIEDDVKVTYFDETHNEIDPMQFKLREKRRNLKKDTGDNQKNQ